MPASLNSRHTGVGVTARLANRYDAVMTTEEGSPEPGAFAGINPYTSTLFWIWVGALVTAGILALMGVDSGGQFDEAAGVAQFASANLFGSLGIGALLVWLLVNGLLWKPPTAPTRAADNRPPNADAVRLD